MLLRRSSAVFVRVAVVCVGVLYAGTGFSQETLDARALENAVRTDAVTIPTPGEFFAAMNKAGKPTWSDHYREPIPTSFTSRAQLALNLGGLIAYGYIAVEARDSQQVKNIGKDIIALAKSLGIDQRIIGRGNSITDFAENSQWGTLEEELEATQNEVKLAMEEQKDEDLVVLLSLGAWIRGTEVVSNVVAGNYTPESAKLLRQPALVGYLRGKIDELPERIRKDASVTVVKDKLGEIEELVSFPRDRSPRAEEVIALRDAVASLTRQISAKSN